MIGLAPYMEKQDDKMKYGYWFGILIFLSGCTKDGRSNLVDAALGPYFIRFTVEAALRGVDIDLDGSQIEGVLDDLDEGVRGQCQHLSNDGQRVVIDRGYWNQATDIEREFLVFHELGHCALNRSHLDATSARGECLSIMHSSSFSCRNTYSGQTRQQFLDELFSN